MTMEERLRSLAETPPSRLEEDTVVGAGAADRVTRIGSPVGDVWIAWSIRGCTGLVPAFSAGSLDAFLARHRRIAYEAPSLPTDLAEVVHLALEEGATAGVPIDLTGLGTFQRSVLTACATIPAGSVRPYGWIADRIHNPGAVRAVGTALGRNPIPLLVPCHRVVRSDGSVGNYAFGPEMKHELLVREGAILA